MSHDAESLLEVDRIDEVLEAAEPPQPPVVVIQYASNGRARYWIMALLILIPLGGGLAYHRLVVDQLQAQTVAIRRDLESWKERFHIESARAEILPDEKDVTPSATSQPAVSTPVVQEKTRAKVASKTSDSGTSKESLDEVIKDRDRSPSLVEKGVRQAGPAANPEPPAVDATERDPDRSPTVVSSTSPAEVSRSPVEPTLQKSDGPARTAQEAVALGPPGISPNSTKITSPRLDPSDALAQAPVGEPESRPAPPGIPIPIPPDPPLPSKEETERIISAEAAQKQEEIRHQVMDKAVEVHRLRYQERVRFHEELRGALKLHGQNAGEAIDQLCNKFGYESDPRRMTRARNYWFTSSKSFGYKADRIRKELDLPETAILNFISDGLHEHLRARDGPRDGNEVRVRAAIVLLNTCSLPASEEASRPTALNAGVAPVTTRQTSIPSSKSSTAARGR